MTIPAGCLRWNSRLGSSRACFLLDIRHDVLLVVLDDPARCKGNGTWLKPESISLKTGARSLPSSAWVNAISSLKNAWALHDVDASLLAKYFAMGHLNSLQAHMRSFDRSEAVRAVANLYIQCQMSDAAEQAALARSQKEKKDTEARVKLKDENLAMAREIIASQRRAKEENRRKIRQEQELLYIEKHRDEIESQKTQGGSDWDAIFANPTHYIGSSTSPFERLNPGNSIYTTNLPPFMGTTLAQKRAIETCTQSLIAKKCLLKGPWDYGFCLDVHTNSSTRIGTYANGSPEFKNEYSLAGEWMNGLKYRGQGNKKTPSISLFGHTFTMGGSDPHMNKLKDLLGPYFGILDGSEIIIIPPSRPHSGTTPAPLLVARELARILNLDGVKKILSPFKKTEDRQAKEVFTHERGDWAKTCIIPTMGLDMLKGKRVLLVDDLVQTGSTLLAIGNLIRQAGPATFITFAVTRTRKGS